MEDFYPSEVARLVLGYLKEVNCPKAWRTFLEECVDLQETYRMLKNGRSSSTKVGRKSLLEILHEYCCLIASGDCDSIKDQKPTAKFQESFLLTESTQTNKDESEKVPVIEVSSSEDETDSETMHDGTQKTNNEHNSIHETSSKLTASQVFPVTIESVANVEVHECMQTDNDPLNLPWESGSKDMSTSCMPIIQPDAETQVQNNFEQSGINLTVDVHSTASNINESSTLVPTSAMENMTTLDNARTWKPLSIETLLQVGTQIPGPQAICSFNESIPASHQQFCSSFSPKYRGLSFFPSNFNVSILPAVQNQRKLPTGFSPRCETLPSNISDETNSNAIDHSLSLSDKAVEKHRERISPIHLSTLLNKAKLNLSLNESDVSTERRKKKKSKKNKDVDLGEHRSSKSNIRDVSCKSPSEENSSLEWENEHSLDLSSRQDT